MPSSYTTSLRFELQFTGENLNLWGEKLNAALSRADDAIAGWLTKPLTGDYALTTANGAADEARRAMLKFTGAGSFIVTVPAVAKRYDVWNACSGDLTLTNGSGSLVVKAGEVVSVVTDGGADFRRVQGTEFGGAALTGVTRVGGLSAPSANSDAATKKYVDDTAFKMGTGALPGQAGNAGKALITDGATAGWGWAVTHGAGLATISDDTLTVAAAGEAELRGGSDDTKAATAAGVSASLAEVTLTNSGTNIITSGDAAPNHARFINAYVVLAGNWTLPNLLSPKIAAQGRIRVQNDATGGRTLAYGGNWKPEGGVLPVMPTAANAVAFIDFEVVTPTYIRFRMTSM